MEGRLYCSLLKLSVDECTWRESILLDCITESSSLLAQMVVYIIMKREGDYSITHNCITQYHLRLWGLQISGRGHKVQSHIHNFHVDAYTAVGLGGKERRGCGHGAWLPVP